MPQTSFGTNLTGQEKMKREKEGFKLVIFDFDGTIADSFEACFNSIDKIFKKRGWPALTEKAKEQAKDLSAQELFDYFKIPKYKLVFAVRKIFNEMGKNGQQIGIFRGIKKTLKEIRKNKIKIILLTSNNKKNVEKIIQKNNLNDFFEEAYYKSGIFSKHIIVNKIIRKFKVKKSEVVMIGDEIRDVKAAKKSGIKIIAVTWGYNTGKSLKKHNPDYFVDEPNEINKILIKNSKKSKIKINK
jgi:phosphoglycolate phosphatase